MRTIILIPGDGIGSEVVEAALKVLTNEIHSRGGVMRKNERTGLYGR